MNEWWFVQRKQMYQVSGLTQNGKKREYCRASWFCWDCRKYARNFNVNDVYNWRLGCTNERKRAFVGFWKLQLKLYNGLLDWAVSKVFAWVVVRMEWSIKNSQRKKNNYLLSGVEHQLFREISVQKTVLKIPGTNVLNKSKRDRDVRVLWLSKSSKFFGLNDRNANTRHL